MKIAFLTPEYPNEKIGHAAGIGTSIKNLATTLVKKGHSITVFVYAQKEATIIQDEGVIIHLIEDKKYYWAKWFFYRKWIQNYCNRIINEQQIELIEAPDWTGITAFMKFKIPLVIRFHGSDTYFCHLEKRKQKIKNYWFEKLAVNKATAFIAPTRFAAELSAKLFRIKNKTIQIIPYGLELRHFENPNPQWSEKGLILYVGTIIRKKGVFELPEIFNKVRIQCPEAKLVLIGGDSSDVQTGSHSTWQLLEKKFNADDLKNVEYLGKMPYTEVRNYIQKANVCVFPSFAETLGMVTIESMALQKPVVNTNIGWAQELIVDAESGFLVHPQEHLLYANRIIAILNDTNLGLTMGKNARKRVEQLFDIEKIAQQNVLFYQSIIDKL